MLEPKTLLWPLLEFFARHRLSWATAQVLSLVTRHLVVANRVSRGGKRPFRILALNTNKAGVLQDVEESFRGCDEFQVYIWPSYALRPLAAALLSPKLDHNNYLTSDPEIDSSKKAYRGFLKQVWKHYCSISPCDAVLAGNFAYYQQREFGAALEECGTPFIAIHKENVRPPKRVKEYWAKIYRERRGPFVGRKILVYNEIERELEISCGVAEPDRIQVTGMPRLDRLHRWRRSKMKFEHHEDVDRPQLLFFSFSRMDKLTAPGRKGSGAGPKGRYEIAGEWGRLGWDRMWAESHRAAIEIAKLNCNSRVIVKTKGQLRKEEEIQAILGVSSDGLPPNLELIAGGNPFNLITRSHVVIGFNTTGLLEAIAAGKPVIVPNFHEASEPKLQSLIIDLGDAVERASSSEDLIARASRHLNDHVNPSPDLSPAAIQTLEHWVGNSDGCSGERVLTAIRNEISSK